VGGKSQLYFTGRAYEMMRAKIKIPNIIEAEVEGESLTTAGVAIFTVLVVTVTAGYVLLHILTSLLP